MKYLITITLNEKGRKLMSKKTHGFFISKDHELTSEEIENIIDEVIPKEIIDSYSVLQNEFTNLKVGDYIKEYDWSSYFNREGNRFEMKKITEITEEYIKIEDNYSDFDFKGKQINSLEEEYFEPEYKLVIPSKSEIENYEEDQERENLLHELHNLLEVQLWSIKTEVLKEIYEKLSDKNSLIDRYR